MTLALKPPAWMADAVCASVDPEIFFPQTKGDLRPTRAAKAICATCPVIAQCFEYALRDSSLDGIWGGTTLRERQEARRGTGLSQPGGGSSTHCRNGHERPPGDVGWCEKCRIESRKRSERKRQERKRLAREVERAAKALRAAMPNDDPVEVVTRRMEVMGVPA